MKTPNTLRVFNGCNKTNTGWRCVVIDPNGVLRPVQSQKFGPLIDKRTTCQMAQAGDYVITHEYYPHKTSYHQYDGKDLKTIQRYELPDSVLTKSAMMESWLKAVGLQESYLPVGEAWDGINTVSSKKKELRIRRLFEGIDPTFVDKLVAHATTSHRDLVPTSWIEFSKPLKRSHDLFGYDYVVEYYFDGSCKLIQLKPGSVYIVSHDTKSCIPIAFKPPVGSYPQRVEWVLLKRGK